MAKVRERERGVACASGKETLQVARAGQERGFFGRRKREEMRARRRRFAWFRVGGRAREHEVCVRARDPEGAHPREPLAVDGGPRLLGGGHVQRERAPGNARVRLLEVKAGRNDAVVERQGRLDEAGHPGCALGVSEVRLHGPDGTRPAGRAAIREDGAQGPELDGIARSRAGAMGLDVCDETRRHARMAIGLAQHVLLPALPGSGHEAARPAVVVDGAAEDDRVDAVAVGLGASQRLEGDESRSFAAHISVGPRVAELAAAVRGEHLRLRIRDADAGLQDDVRAARQGELALPRPDALAREVDRGEGGRARGVDGEARTLEPEGVG
jgi:hypothetical protein